MKTSYGFDKEQKLWVPKSDLFGKYYYADFGYTVLGFGGGVEQGGLLASVYDGSNDYGSVASLSGVTDGAAGTFFAILRLDGGNATNLNVFTIYTTGTRVEIKRGTGDAFSTTLRLADGTTILNQDSSVDFTSGTTWIYFLESWNLVATPVAHLWIQNIDRSNIFIGPTEGTIDYTGGSNLIGAWDGGTNKYFGAMSEVWIDLANYNDIREASVRAGFHTPGLAPKYLGAQGELATGAVPDMYYPNGDPSDDKSGNGNNMSITGALVSTAGPGA